MVSLVDLALPGAAVAQQAVAGGAVNCCLMLLFVCVRARNNHARNGFACSCLAQMYRSFQIHLCCCYLQVHPSVSLKLLMHFL